MIALFLAAVFLGERVRRAAITGSLVASLGVLAIAAGEVRAHAPADAVLGSVACLVASVLYAGSLVLLRRQAQVADPLEVALFTASCLVECCSSARRGFRGCRRARNARRSCWRRYSARDRRWRSPGPTATPRRRCWRRSNIPRSCGRGCLGYAAFGEHVTPWTVAGALLIIAGCAVAVRRAPAAPAPQTEAAA